HLHALRQRHLDSPVAQRDRAQSLELVFEDTGYLGRIADKVIFAVGVLRQALQQFLVELDPDAHRRERNLIAIFLDQIDTRGFFVGLSVGQDQHPVQPVAAEIFLDLVDSSSHPERHLRAAADFEQVDIVERSHNRALVVRRVGVQDNLRLVSKNDDRNLDVAIQVLGQELDRLDYEFEAPLVVHRPGAVDNDAEVEWQPTAAAGAPFATGDRLEQDIEDEIFCARQHMVAARERLEAKRIGHSSNLPKLIVGSSCRTWQPTY